MTYKSRTYHSWDNMKQRCSNPKREQYRRYGACGIAYDPRWESYKNFFEDMGERPAGTTLDRRDGTKGYCKSNCRWATLKEQTENKKPRRDAIYYEGKSTRYWADKWGVPLTTANGRIHTLNKYAARGRGRVLLYAGKSAKEWCAIWGVNEPTARKRFARGVHLK